MKEGSGSPNWSKNHLMYMLKCKLPSHHLRISKGSTPPGCYDQAAWAKTGPGDDCHLTYQKTDEAYLK